MRVPSLSLQGRVALVTGAGSGIGRAAAALFAGAGARVALVGHTASELEDARAEIATVGGEAVACVADVSDPAAVEAAVARVEQTWGALHHVVANAGVNGLWAPLDQIAPEDWDRTLAINLRGTYLTIRAALPLLRRAGGSVVVVSSVNGTRMFSNTGATAYAVSKAGQLALARMLALEFAPLRIRVNTVCPGAIRTRIGDNTERRDLDKIGVPVAFPEGEIPLTSGEPGSAAQVAELILFLASDASAHITGAEVFIDGGQSLLQG